MPKKKPTIINDKENPVPEEILAKSIVAISEGISKIQKGPLSRRAITVLLKDSTGESLNSINKILSGIEDLAKNYLKK